MSLKIKGFTVIEILIVLAILGVLALASIPSILNTMETRSLENAARDILTTMQAAKIQAVSTKLNHRVRFSTGGSQWTFQIERETSAGTWTTLSKFARKEIPSKFIVNVDLPDNDTVVFAPIGFIYNFDSEHKTITIQSEKLKSYDQPDLATITLYGGGSIQYRKSESTG